ncbi:MAG: protein kinase [Planctomycetota bacterium]
MTTISCPSCSHEFNIEVKPETPVVRCPECHIVISAANYFGEEIWEQSVKSANETFARSRSAYRAQASRGLSTFSVPESQRKSLGLPHNPEPAAVVGAIPANAAVNTTEAVPAPKRINRSRKQVAVFANPNVRSARSTGARPALIPEQFGPFTRGEEISHGGMGVVYRAYDNRLDKDVALKVLLPWGENSEEVVERFMREARCAEHIDHPGIVKVYEADEINGRQYIAMELVDGLSLDRAMRKKRYKVEEGIQIMLGVAEALAVAHEHNIIHRDIKPGNILVPKLDVPKITDFGLARDLRDETRLTQQGAVMGTPAYMSPEQAEGKTAAIGPATDVWAAGAVMYELLTGTPPFRGDTAMRIKLEIMKRRPIAPRVANPRIPREIEAVIMKCLQVEPSRRYPTARELAMDLRAFTEGFPVSVKPSASIREAFGRPAVKRATAAGIGALALAVVALGVWSLTTGGSEASANATTAMTFDAVEPSAGPALTTEDIDGRIKTAIERYNQGDLNQSEKDLLYVYDAADKSQKTQSASVLGVIYFKQQQFSDSATWFGKACELEPSNATLWFKRGASLLKLGAQKQDKDAYMSAYEAFDKVIRLDPSNAVATQKHRELRAALRIGN